MTCHDAHELFSVRVDGALTDDERRGLDAHLAGCPECRRELARFEATVGFVDRVLAAARPVPWTERLRRRLLSPLALRRPIEVTVVALVALTAVYLYERTPELQDAFRTAPPVPVAPAPQRQAPQSETSQNQALQPAEPARSRPAPLAADRVGPVTPKAKEEQVSQYQEAARQLAKTPVEAVAPPPAVPPPPRPQPASPDAGTVAAPASPPVAAPPPPPAAPPAAVSAAVPASAPPTPAAPPPAPAAPTASASTGAVPIAPPPAPEARAESKPRALDTAASGERERQAKEAEARKSAATARSSALAGRLAAAPDVAGTLTVADRDAAHRALAELAARLGGAETFRRTDANASSVDLVVPATAYAELAEGLGRIGRWQPDSVPSPLPAQVRVTVRLAAP
jgi:anti-sigma factor RsiW